MKNLKIKPKKKKKNDDYGKTKCKVISICLEMEAEVGAARIKCFQMHLIT